LDLSTSLDYNNEEKNMPKEIQNEQMHANNFITTINLKVHTNARTVEGRVMIPN